MANMGGDRLVIFSDGTNTWEWDGNDWTLRAPADSPSPRQYVQSATLNGGVMLFGGATANTSTATFYADTWSWDGTDWTRLLAAGTPAARHASALGSLGSSVLMFGGYGSGGTMYSDAWTWNGTTWVAAASGPSARMGVSFAAR